MSYDLVVWAARAATDGELEELVQECPGLVLLERGPQGLTVGRGVRGRYCLSLDGPDPVAAEDVDPDVTAAALGICVRYEVLVEGSVQADVPHAVRFARRLADKLEGVAVDQQTGQVWARRGLRSAGRPQRGESVDVLRLVWHASTDEMTDEYGAVFVDAARDLLPEALPRRFGDYEPLQGSVERDGVAGFIEALKSAEDGMYFTATVPCLGGSLPGPWGPWVADKIWEGSLSFLVEPLGRPEWRDPVRAFFGRVADELPAFHAHASVDRGATWNGRDISWGGEAIFHKSPIVNGRWQGLRTDAQWWTWLGSPFEQWFDQLPEDRTTRTASGMLYDATDVHDGTVVESRPLSDWLPRSLFYPATSEGQVI